MVLLKLQQKTNKKWHAVYKKDVGKLREILNTNFSNIDDILDTAGRFYLTLDTVLMKANYAIEENFNMNKELTKNYENINNFITDIILDSNKDKCSNPEKKSNVILITIHSAKGLEFEEVHFLYSPSVEYSYIKLEENRRLFYTAISRASQNLYIYDLWRRRSIDEIIKDFQSTNPKISFEQSKEQNLNEDILINYNESPTKSELKSVENNTIKKTKTKMSTSQKILRFFNFKKFNYRQMTLI